MALWELDEFAPPVFLGFVRTMPPPNAFRGERWLPNQTISDLEFEYVLGSYNRPVMAHVMGFDSEAPLHGRPGSAARVTGELPPIKRKARIGEKAIIRFLTPRVGTTDQAEAVRTVYTTTTDLLDTIQARVEWLRMQALSEDTIVYNEAGVKFAFDFGLDDEFQIDLTTEQDGDGNSVSSEFSTVWSDHTNADPIADMAALQLRVQNKWGVSLAEFVMSATKLPDLYMNAKMRGEIRGTGAPTAPLTPAEVQTLFSIHNLPPVSTYDVVVQQEDEYGAYADVRPMAKNKLFGVPEGGAVGNTLWGPTAESRVLYGTSLAGAAPGIWAETYGTTEPPSEWVKAAAVAFPSMPRANQLVQMTITAA